MNRKDKLRHGFSICLMTVLESENIEREILQEITTKKVTIIKKMHTRYRHDKQQQNLTSKHCDFRIQRITI